ncbi:MAG: cysteine desulfurase CsdA [Flavobacteriales bacterium]|nr:MAG: cysteine desulfurase CsdA [Flavobacteriales bacterium]
MNEPEAIATIAPFDVQKVRNDFPILNQKVHEQPLVYLDNAASSQKPKAVIEALEKYYTAQHSNVHRGVHYLSSRATESFENVRGKAQRLINAKHAHEIIFTRGTTEAVNLVASSFGKKFISEGDEVLISEMEHHSNIVPWQIVCEDKGAKLKVIPVNDAGELIFEAFEKLLSEKTKIVAVNHVSNTLGTINPVKKIIEKAHEFNVPVLLDAAQAVPHMKTDVQDLNADFYCFSSHKMYGPTGIGILYGKEKWLEEMPPYQGGGEMIETVTFEKTTYNDLPYKFEAGTPNIADVIAFGAAIDYLDSIGYEDISAYEKELLEYATEQLLNINGLRIIGTAENKASVISFLMDEIHPYDIGTILDQLGIAVRTGHHCTEPLMNRFGISGTVRASFAFYNTKEEVDVLVKGLLKAKEMLS